MRQHHHPPRGDERKQFVTYGTRMVVEHHKRSPVLRHLLGFPRKVFVEKHKCVEHSTVFSREVERHAPLDYSNLVRILPTKNTITVRAREQRAQTFPARF